MADRSSDPQLPRWLRRFEADFDDAGDEAGLAMRLLVELLGLERQGRHHDIVARRKALRDLSPVDRHAPPGLNGMDGLEASALSHGVGSPAQIDVLLACFLLLDRYH